jgi:hypothetical protein
MVAGVACYPPETVRTRGGDRGADIGNRSPVVELHAGSVIYPERRCAVRGAECTGPIPSQQPPTGPPSVQASHFVLEHMGRGGAVRRVVYEPPPDLTLRDPTAIELPFPGPGTGDGTDEDAGEEAGAPPAARQGQADPGDGADGADGAPDGT